MIARLFWACVGLVVYVYAGYPLVLTALARLNPRRQYPPPAEAVPVTLLIAAYNEADVIDKKLQNSLALDYPRQNLRILVAADGSDDETPAIVRRYADRGVQLSFSPVRRGKMAAINRALPLARGEVVMFSDANNLYRSDALRRLVAPFADPTVGVTGGAKTITRDGHPLGDSEGLYWKYESFIKQQETRLGCCTGVAGEIMAVRRNLLEPAPDSIINDDFYMAMRIVRRGHRVVYVPAARSVEPASASAQDEAIRRARIVAGRYQAIGMAHKLLPFRRPLIAWQIVSHKFLRPLVPLAMIGALLTNLAAVVRPARPGKRAVCRLARPFNYLLLGGQAAFYGLAWFGSRGERTGRWGRLLYLPTFLVNSNLAALVGLKRYLTNRQTTLWRRAQRRNLPHPEL